VICPEDMDLPSLQLLHFVRKDDIFAPVFKSGQNPEIAMLRFFAKIFSQPALKSDRLCHFRHMLPELLPA
jgi:hypothetical protein